MANINLYNGDGDERSRTLQVGITKSLGFLPEGYQAMGRSGKFLESVLGMEHAAGSNLDERTRQLLSVAVSAVNGCGYCLHAHRAMALKAGCTEQEVTGALEVAAMMSASNTFFKAAGLTHDVTPEALGVAALA
jgi:AhpD family alkylhydroperoxidase